MAGRPSKYDEKLNKRVEKFCKLGATDKELADFLEITESTLNEWKKKYTELSESIKRGKDLADMNVVNSLYKKAIGFKKKAVKIFQAGGTAFEHEYNQYFPPDVTAQIFWLKNRRKTVWADRQEINHNIKLEDCTNEQLQRIADGEPVEKVLSDAKSCTN